MKILFGNVQKRQFVAETANLCRESQYRQNQIVLSVRIAPWKRRLFLVLI
jgi:hypothetical protein